MVFRIVNPYRVFGLMSLSLFCTYNNTDLKHMLREGPGQKYVSLEGTQLKCNLINGWLGALVLWWMGALGCVLFLRALWGEGGGGRGRGVLAWVSAH